MDDPLKLLDLTAMLMAAYGPALALIRGARDPAAYELRFLNWLRSRPLPEDLRRSGSRLVISGPALLWAAYRADLWLLWLALGVFVVLGGLMLIFLSFTQAARTHEANWSALEEPPSVLAHRRRITQVHQLAFLAAWLFSWRELAV